jgi:hypothetical protein
MPNLSDLPVELLEAILEHLYIVDSATFLVSQATDRRFRDVAKRILSRLYHDYDFPDCDFSLYYPNFNSLLDDKFAYLFVPLDCFTQNEKDSQNSFYLTIAGNHTLPFKRLPWAQMTLFRQAYLRSEASWRDLSITEPWLKPITRFEIIREYSGDENGDEIEYFRLDLLDRGILTMGLLYDTLLDEKVHFGNETGHWAFHMGMRLRDHDLLQQYTTFIDGDDDLVDRSENSKQCAILHIEGANVDSDDEMPSFPVGHDWEPTMMEPDRLRFLNWEEQYIDDSVIISHFHFTPSEIEDMC